MMRRGDAPAKAKRQTCCQSAPRGCRAGLLAGGSGGGSGVSSRGVRATRPARRLSTGFSTALAQGWITRDSLLVLQCVLQGGRNGWFAEANSYATRSNTVFCCATAFELSDGSGLWEFKVFGSEVTLKAGG